MNLAPRFTKLAATLWKLALHQALVLVLEVCILTLWFWSEEEVVAAKPHSSHLYLRSFKCIEFICFFREAASANLV